MKFATSFISVFFVFSFLATSSTYASVPSPTPETTLSAFILETPNGVIDRDLIQFLSGVQVVQSEDDFLRITIINDNTSTIWYNDVTYDLKTYIDCSNYDAGLYLVETEDDQGDQQDFWFDVDENGNITVY